MTAINFKKESVRLTVILIGTIITGILLYFCIEGIGNVLITLFDLFMPFLLGYIFMVLTRPVSEFLMRKLKFPKQLAAVAVLILFFGIIGAIVVLIGIKAVDEARNFYLSVPRIYENMHSLILNFSDKWDVMYKNLPPNVQNIISDMGIKLSSAVSEMLNSKSSPIFEKTGIFAKKLPGFFIGFIVFILSSYFLISDDGTVNRVIKNMVSDKTAEAFKRVGNEVRRYLGGYIKAQLSIMCVVFVILLTGFYIINSEYTLFAALIIAVIDAIPFFGTGIALIPWSIISFLNADIRRGIGLAIIYLVVVLTRQLIEPKIVSTKIGMHPIATLMSMYAGYKFFSIGGMILGPITLMLIISFYRAGVFDNLKSCMRNLWDNMKRVLRKH